MKKKGVILLDAEDLDEDVLMETALEAGASDFAKEDDVFEIYTEPDDLSAVRETLEEKGYQIQSADLDMIPASYVRLTDETDIKHMNLLLEHLDEHDDVQNVYHNWEAPDEE